ncbi:MAG: alkaline phosphatase [Opitutaceae bacterium]|nr:alkaline phosphatase [Opitutaceae bacterium]
MLNRRDFLRTGLAGSLLLSTRLRGAPATPRPAHGASDPGQARNLIFLVSDGMSLGTLTLAERHLQRWHGRGSHWLGLYAQPGVRRALMDTSSASSLVTDSAAASSAWGCGHKVRNGAINHAADGRPLTPLFHHVRESGRATGLVTTATITHATPAGFAAQVKSRTEEPLIARQYLDLGINVLLGGGRKFFDPALRADGADLLADYTRAGYQVMTDQAALEAAPADRPWLGLFADGYIPYELDRRADAALRDRVPDLATMTRAALRALSTHPTGFAVQIEGARVDHAAHANDIGGLLHEQLAFDEAVGAALEFAAGRDDTLVIVTTDHGNSNPGLNGTGGNFNTLGESYGDTAACFDRLADLRQTNTWVMAGLNTDSTVPQIRDRVHAATTIALTADECDLLRRALRSEPHAAYRVRNSAQITLGQILANYTSVGWAGTAHTTDLVELAAFGPGSEAVGGLMQNNDLFGVMTRALGVGVAV